MSPFSSFPKEDARVEKNDGSVIGPYKATFAGSTIVIWDAQADIVEDDVILRNLPNGKEERSLVAEATFFQKMHSIPSHYQIKFKKWSGQMEQKPFHNITIHGAQSVQIGDNNTQNIINSIQALNNQIESSTTASEKEKEEAKSLLSEFLNHPLVTSILGAAAGAVIG